MADVKISQLPQASLPLSGAEVFPIVQNGVTVQAPVGNIGLAANISALQAVTPVNNAAINLQGYYAAGDGGGGQFYGVSGAAAGTYVDNGGTIIVPVGGDGSAAWLRNLQDNDTVDVRWFGAKGDYVTDDSITVQNAINYVQALGGTVHFPKGKYTFKSQVTISRPLVSQGGTPTQYSGGQTLKISGYGAQIYTEGNIAAFKFDQQNLPFSSVIEGFTIFHNGNTTAKAGIWLVGAQNATCKDISVVVSSSLPADYSCFLLEDTTTTSLLGCYWATLDSCSMRPIAGEDGFAPYGVSLYGAQNAVTIKNCKFSGANTHILLSNYPGQAYAPNAVVIDGNAFEAPNTSTAIRLYRELSVYHIAGTRITNNRFESVFNAVELAGTATLVQVPTYISGNYADTGIINFVNNPLNIPVTMLDVTQVSSPTGPVRYINNYGTEFESSTPAPAIFVGEISGTTLTVSSVSSGLIVPYQTLTGAGVTTDTKIVNFVSGTKYGAGVYTVSKSQTVAAGTTITGTNSDAFTLRVNRLNTGVNFRRLLNNDRIAFWQYKNFGGANGTVIGGSLSPYFPFGLVGVRGVSSSDIVANNFRGRTAFSAQTSKAITFSAAETDADYQILLEFGGNVTLWPSSKATSGFTINSSSAITGTVYWTLIR